MPASFLVLNYRSGGVPILQTYYNSTLTAFGNTFGVLDTGTADNNAAFNRVVRFIGQRASASTLPFPPAEAVFDVIYAVASDTVYRTFDSGTTWQAVFVLTPITAGNTVKKSGLNIVYLNGRPAITVFWHNTGGAWLGAYSHDGVAWTIQGPFSLGASVTATNGLTSDTVYNNSVYCTTIPASGGGVICYNPGSNIISSTTLTGASGLGTACLTEYNRRLFCLYNTTASSGTNLSEIAGQQSNVITSNIHGAGAFAAGSMVALFVDPNNNNLYGIFNGGTGQVCYEWTSSLGTPTNITSTVFPTALSTSADTGRMFIVVDGVDVSGVIRIWLYFATSGAIATQWNYFLWQGPSLQIFQPSIALGSAGDALPANRQVSGQYFWYFGSPYTMITERTYLNNSGGIRLTLRLYGPSSTDAFRAFFAFGDEEYPTRPCTLANPTTGTVEGGTVVMGVNGTNSGTFFQVTWLASDDGVSEGDRFKLVCEEFFIN